MAASSVPYWIDQSITVRPWDETGLILGSKNQRVLQYRATDREDVNAKRLKDEVKIRAQGGTSEDAPTWFNRETNRTGRASTTSRISSRRSMSSVSDAPSKDRAGVGTGLSENNPCYFWVRPADHRLLGRGQKANLGKKISLSHPIPGEAAYSTPRALERRAASNAAEENTAGIAKMKETYFFNKPREHRFRKTNEIYDAHWDRGVLTGAGVLQSSCRDPRPQYVLASTSNDAIFKSRYRSLRQPELGHRLSMATDNMMTERGHLGSDESANPQIFTDAPAAGVRSARGMVPPFWAKTEVRQRAASADGALDAAERRRFANEWLEESSDAASHTLSRSGLRRAFSQERDNGGVWQRHCRGVREAPWRWTSREEPGPTTAISKEIGEAVWRPSPGSASSRSNTSLGLAAPQIDDTERRWSAAAAEKKCSELERPEWMHQKFPLDDGRRSSFWQRRIQQDEREAAAALSAPQAGIQSSPGWIQRQPRDVATPRVVTPRSATASYASSGVGSCSSQNAPPPLGSRSAVSSSAASNYRPRPYGGSKRSSSEADQYIDIFPSKTSGTRSSSRPSLASTRTSSLAGSNKSASATSSAFGRDSSATRLSSAGGSSRSGASVTRSISRTRGRTSPGRGRPND